jgi:hypothetical protein
VELVVDRRAQRRSGCNAKFHSSVLRKVQTLRLTPPQLVVSFEIAISTVWRVTSGFLREKRPFCAGVCETRMLWLPLCETEENDDGWIARRSALAGERHRAGGAWERIHFRRSRIQPLPYIRHPRCAPARGVDQAARIVCPRLRRRPSHGDFLLHQAGIDCTPFEPYRLGGSEINKAESIQLSREFLDAPPLAKTGRRSSSAACLTRFRSTETGKDRHPVRGAVPSVYESLSVRK